MNTVAQLKRQAPVPRARTHAPTPREDINAAAGDLHLLLQPTATLLRSFPSEKALMRFRALVYSINKQGEYRFRTVRAEREMFALLIWRML